MSGNVAVGDFFTPEGYGGGIYSSGTVTLTNSTVSGNWARFGGGLYNGGSCTMTNSTVSGNSAEALDFFADESWGGGILNSGTLTLNNTIVALNDAPHGADIGNWHEGTFTNNSSLVGVDPGFLRNPSDGGDGWSDDWSTPGIDESANDDYGDLRLAETSLAINRGNNTLAVDDDGLTLTTDLGGNLRTVHGQVDIGAYEYQGTALLWEAPSTVVTTLTDVVDTTDGDISLREACVYGGSLEQDVTFAADLSGGTIVLGGRELYMYQSLTIDATPVGGLSIDAAGQSRVMFVAGSDTEISLTGLTLTRGSTTGDGGGIYNASGSLVLTNSTVSGNSATGYYSTGGGIYNPSGTLTVTNSTVSGNSAVGSGGGIKNVFGTVTLTNSTVSGNSAAVGGGIANYIRGVILSNTVVALNDAPTGADVHSDGGSVTNNSSLVGVDPLFVRNPSDGGDGWGDDPATAGVDESANDDYGDLRLLPASPAIDAGDNALLPADEFDVDGDADLAEVLPMDLDRHQRIRGPRVDIGAYEYSVTGTNYAVNSLADVVAADGVVTLREAIEAANTNTAVTPDVPAGSATLQDVITFDQAALSAEAGVAVGQPLTITLGGTQLEITDSLDIQGFGADVLAVDADGRSRVVHISVDTEVDLTGLTITGGLVTGDGGGICNSGTLTLTNTTVSGNSATGRSAEGGGIKNYDGTLTLTDSTVSGNRATGGSFTGGGGIDNDRGTVTLTNSTVSDNRAIQGGGVRNGEYESSLGTVTLTNSTVSGNYADGTGGGIYHFGTVMLTNSTVSDNSAGVGAGGIYIAEWQGYSGTLMLTNSTVSDNRGQYWGGGIYNGGTVTLTDSTVSGNSTTWIHAGGGGGIDNGGTLTLTNSTVSGNSAAYGSPGGGITNYDGTVTLVNSTVSGNSADYGGGIYNEGTLTLTNSTVSGNSADYGGGILNLYGGTVTLTNSTVSGNYAGSWGGGISNTGWDGNVGTLTLNNTIVALNDAPTGSDVHDDGGTVTNNSSLVGVDPLFVRNPSDGGDGWGDDPDTPDIDESANDDYGDLRLQPGSPAIDAGDNALLPTDEFDVDGDGDVAEVLPMDLARHQRIRGARVDIGAYEYSVTGTNYAVNSLADVVAADGVVTLREAIEAANTNTAVTPDVPAGSATLQDVITFDQAALSAEAGVAVGEPVTITLGGTQLEITDSLAIHGLGADILTIDADGRSRVFHVSGAETEVDLTGLTITGGAVTDANGGGVYIGSGTLTLTNSTVSGNSASDGGGGIYSESGTVTLTHSTVSGNSAAWGGGIDSQFGTAVLTNSTVSGNVAEDAGGISNWKGTVTLTNSTVSGNLASWVGGGIATRGTLALTNTTVSGNSATGERSLDNRGGGGIYNEEGTVTLTNSTVSGNSAMDDYGGGIYNDLDGTLTLTNSTVSGNTAVDYGGGIYNDSGTVTLNNTIVALNDAPTVADIVNGTFTNNSSLVGLDPLFVRNPSDGGDGWGDDPATAGVDESANDDYGDLRLLPTSPAIDAGDSALLPADEFDVDGDGDVAEVLPMDLARHQRIRGPRVDIGAYEYAVTGTNYAVNSLADVVAADGVVTLREAIEAANTNTAVTPDVPAGSATLKDVITFDQAALSAEAGVAVGQPLTITLDGSQLAITDSLDIQGLGADVLIVDADEHSRVLHIAGAETDVDLTGLTIKGGQSTSHGGGIHNDEGTVTLTNVTVSANTSTATSYGGGGIHNNLGTLALTNSTVSNNEASRHGGGIYNWEGMVTLTNSTVSDNSAGAAAGGIANSGTLMLIDSTVSDNEAVSNGGGIFNWDTLTLTNSTVSGNSAASAGGGIGNSGMATLTNTTVSGNASQKYTSYDATVGGGGIYNNLGTLMLTNTTVSGNWAECYHDIDEDFGAAYSLGGGILNWSGTLTLTNSTVLGNSVFAEAFETRVYGGGICNWKGTVTPTATLTNVTVSHNWADVEPLPWEDPLGGLHYGPIDVQGAHIYGGFTNHNSLVGGNPGFVRNPSSGADGRWGTADDDYGDLRLLPGSPAIDAGDNALLPADEFDLDGDGNVAEPLPVDLAGGPRVLGPRVDIGAYEGAVVVAEIFGDGVDALVAGGALSLGEGARLELVIGGGGDEFVAGEYTLIEAAGGLTGTFASVTDLGGYVSTNGDGLTYDEVAGTVSLTLDRDLNPGDANLDCATDVSDRIIWNTNNFTAGTTFITGDFDGDGVTDVSDRIIWNSNNFTVATAAPAPRAEAGAMAAVLPADTEDVPAWAGVSAAPAAEPMPLARPALADTSGFFGMGVGMAVGVGVVGAADGASSGLRTDGSPRWVAADDVTISAAQLEVDLGVGLASGV